MDTIKAIQELEEQLSNAIEQNKVYTAMCIRTEIEKLQRELRKEKLGSKVFEILAELESRNFIYSINRGFSGHCVTVGADEIEYEGDTLEEALERMAEAEF